MLTPERSIQIQRSIGADIMMQVCKNIGICPGVNISPTNLRQSIASASLLCSWMMSLTLVMRTRTGLRRQDTELSGGWTGELFSEVWIIALVCKVNFFTRCLSAHPRPDLQNLFPIVQGGLEEEKRKDCADQVFCSACLFVYSESEFLIN